MFAGYRVVFGPNGTIVYKAKQAEYQKLQREIDEQNELHKSLEDQVRALQGDPRAIEREAREKLGFVKPGEIVLVQPQLKHDPRADSSMAQQVTPAPALPK
jgi:cell division protein FtsB